MTALLTAEAGKWRRRYDRHESQGLVNRKACNGSTVGIVEVVLRRGQRVCGASLMNVSGRQLNLCQIRVEN